MKLFLPQGILYLSQVFKSFGYTLYLVGGFVRNSILGLPVTDFDICSAALPEDVVSIAQKTGLKVVEKSFSLGTVEIHLSADNKHYIFEHTTFRRDFYPSGGTHRPYSVTFTKNIDEDSKRRDFTIGSLYMDISAQELIDPTGKGLSDLKQRIIRSAAEKPEDTIRDDGLRIMRMARFCAELGFSIEDSLLECAKRYCYLLSDISAERKRDELIKILLSDIKYADIKSSPLRGLEVLFSIGALKYVLPHINTADAAGVSLPKSFFTCAAVKPRLNLRLAALLHDIGKPGSPATAADISGNGIDVGAAAKRVLADLRFDNKTINSTVPLIKYHMFDIDAKPADIRRLAVKLGRNAFADLIELRRAVQSANRLNNGSILDNWTAELEKMRVEQMPWSIKELDITGAQISNMLGIGSGKVIGEILNSLHSECILKPDKNVNPQLKRRVIQLINEKNITIC